MLLAIPALSSIDALPASASSYPTSHTLNLSFLQDPGQPPDPDVYYAGEGLLLTRNMYQGLLQYKTGTAQRVLEPELATSWSVSKNGLEYTFDCAMACFSTTAHRLPRRPLLPTSPGEPPSTVARRTRSATWHR